MTESEPRLADRNSSPVAQERAPTPGRGEVGRRTPSLPGPFVLVAIAVLLVNLAVGIMGARSASTTSDEPVHVSRMQSYLDTGWYLPAFQMKGTEPANTTMTYVYGPAAALPGHWAAVLVGAEAPDTVSSGADAQFARRMVINLFGVLGIAAAAGLGWMLLGSWRWGVTVAAFLSCVPMWTGHSMFNIKDIPVAAGYTLLTAGLVGTAVWARRRHLVASAAVMALGIVIAVGTRPGMWVACALSAGLLVVGFAVFRIPRSRWLPALLTVIAAVLVGFLGLLLLYPKAFSSPLTAAQQAMAASAEFPTGGAILRTAGFGHTEHPPWFYIPGWLGAQIPVVIVVLAAIGLLSGLVLIARQAFRHGPELDARQRAMPLAVGLVIVQAIGLPVAAVLLGSVLYGGVRQVLFVVPAISVLAVVGLARAIAWRSGRSHPWWPRAVLIVTAAGLILPTVDQIRMFPYGYTYFNEIATLRPIDGAWATDYWRASLDEVYAGPASRVDPAVDDLVITGNWIAQPIPAECGELGRVTRPLHGQDVLMFWAAACPGTFPLYPMSGIDFRLGGNGSSFINRGWSEPAVWGVHARYRTAVVRVTLPARLRGRPLELRLAASPNPFATASVEPISVSANRTLIGEFVPDAAQPNVTFRVPRALAEDLGEGRLAIEFKAAAAEVIPNYVLASVDISAS